MLRQLKKRLWAGRRRGAPAVCAVLAAAAFGAVQAPSASALGEQCSGSNIQGGGAFLQSTAQARWSTKESSGFNGSGSPLACSGSQGAGKKPQMDGYVPFGSAAALHAWGADDGVLHIEGREFLGTDIAPAGPVGEKGTELANMKKALGSDLVVVPVTQTAVAIAAHPPALPAHTPCTVSGISAEQLEKVFSGLITNWLQLSTASDSEPGGDCDQAITRVVREESAGVTYQFKHFLDQVNPSGLACSGEAKRTWAQLQAAAGESPPNLEWPSKAQCQEGEGPVTTVTGKVGEGEVGPLTFVKANPGTITYASLPEAENYAPVHVIDVYNGVQFADPVSGENEANCGAAEYALPENWAEGISVDWSQVYGSQPGIGETAENAYPICTLSWDLTASDAVAAFGGKAATTAHDYLDFVRSAAGQEAVQPVYYAPLPGPVAEAATAAVAQIGGEEEEGEEEEEGGGSGTVLCKVAPEPKAGVLDCPSGQGFTEGKVTGGLVPESTAYLATIGPEGVIKCTDAHYVGEFNEDGTPAGGLYQLQFGNTEACSSSLPEWSGSNLQLEGTPYDASKFTYLGTLAPQGAFVIAKTGGGQVLLRLEGSTTCVYLPSFLGSQIANGSPTKMVMQGTWGLAEGSKEECPETLQQSAQLTVAATGSENPFYIAGE